MSNLAMTQTEEKSIDSKVEQMMDWAQSRQIEAEQLALDSARLMACTTDRLDRLSKQGFYKRCWSRFNGDANAMERANVNDVIQMQKMAFRYVNMLQEQQLLMAHSLLSLKNNLNSLAVREEETRNLIALLAQRTLERFEQLEGRVGKLETSSNLHDWLFALEERDYEEKIPTDYMRLLRVINDFYDIKNDNWNNNDLMFMRKAIRTVGLNPKEKLSINAFIDKLAEEIQSSEVGFDAYDKAITLFAPDDMENYSQFAIENVSSLVFATLHGLNTQYKDRLDMVEDLQDDLGCSQSEALKKLLSKTIQRMNVNLDYEFPLAETAIEILGCMRLMNRLAVSWENKTVSLNDQSDNIKIYNKIIHNDTGQVKILNTIDDILDYIIQIGSQIGDESIKLNKGNTFLKDRNNGTFAGKLPEDVSKIIKLFGVKIPIYEIDLWLDSGSKGLLVTLQDDIPKYIGAFDRSEQIYGIINFADTIGSQSEDINDRLAQIEDIMQKIDERISGLFPEIKN